MRVKVSRLTSSGNILPARDHIPQSSAWTAPCNCHDLAGIPDHHSLDQDVRWGRTVPLTLEEDSIYLRAKTKGNEKFQSLKKTAHPPPPFSDCSFTGLPACSHQYRIGDRSYFYSSTTNKLLSYLRLLISQTGAAFLALAHILLLLTGHVTRAQKSEAWVLSRNLEASERTVAAPRESQPCPTPSPCAEHFTTRRSRFVTPKHKDIAYDPRAYPTAVYGTTTSLQDTNDPTAACCKQRARSPALQRRLAMANGGPPTSQAVAGGSQPAPSEAVQSKRDLTSWWKQFKRTDKRAQEQAGTRHPSCHITRSSCESGCGAYMRYA